MRSRSSALIPGPLSAIATDTAPFSAESVTPIVPPSGVQRNAFDKRLTMICSTRSPSLTITGFAPTSRL